MAHDASKVVLGSNRSSFRVVDNKVGAVEAGLAVRLKNDDTISTAKTDGSLMGVSFGKDLSDAGRTNICREGLLVPLLLTAAFTPVIGAQVAIDDVTGMGKATGAGVTAVNAIYRSGVLTGVKEDGTTANVALIDFQGGF